MAKLVMHLHVHNIALLICISTYSSGALNPPRIVASATHSRGHVPVAGVDVETIVPPLPTPPAVYSITAGDRKRKKADRRARAACGARANASNSQLNSNSSPNHFHQHHCECCCDSLPPLGVIRPLLLWPCSCSSSCSDHIPTLATNTHSPVRYLTMK